MFHYISLVLSFFGFHKNSLLLHFNIFITILFPNNHLSSLQLQTYQPTILAFYIIYIYLLYACLLLLSIYNLILILSLPHLINFFYRILILFKSMTKTSIYLFIIIYLSIIMLCFLFMNSVCVIFNHRTSYFFI